MFGSCLKLDGNNKFVILPSAAFPAGPEITLAIWVKVDPDTEPGNNSLIFSRQGSAYVRTCNVHLPYTDGKIYFQVCSAGVCTTLSQAPATGDDFRGPWHHWAFAKSASDLKIYRDGVLMMHAPGSVPLPASDGAFLGTLEGAGCFTGLVSNLRIYSTALTVEDLNKVRQMDTPGTAAFLRFHPIDFDLSDTNGQQVLAITSSPAAAPLTLEIHNSSAYEITYQPLTGTPALGNCHLELRFRPGTIASATGLSLTETSEWVMAAGVPPNNFTSLYFRRQPNAKTRTLGKDERQTITLHGLSADARGGARGTRAELLYSQVAYTGAATPLTGSRVLHLNVMNENGRKEIPLHAGIVGSNTVLNDGKSLNRLRLRITNLLPKDAITLTKDSSFTLSFDTAATLYSDPWALLSVGNSLALSIAPQSVDQRFTLVPLSEAAISRTWQVSPAAAPISLAAGDHFEVDLFDLNAANGITGLLSDQLAGLAYLHIQYANIAGYWDGELLVALEKGPITVFEPQPVDPTAYVSRVGIGTATPHATLEVNGVTVLSDGSFDKADTINLMTAGSLVIGSVNASYGGSNPSAALRFQSLGDTEVVVKSKARLASLLLLL